MVARRVVAAAGAAATQRPWRAVGGRQRVRRGRAAWKAQLECARHHRPVPVCLHTSLCVATARYLFLPAVPPVLAYALAGLRLFFLVFFWHPFTSHSIRVPPDAAHSSIALARPPSRSDVPALFWAGCTLNSSASGITPARCAGTIGTRQLLPRQEYVCSENTDQ